MPPTLSILSSDVFLGGGGSFWFFWPLFAMYRRILIFLSLGQVYLKYEITTISQEMNLFCTFEYLFKCLNYRLYLIQKKLELFWKFGPAECDIYFAISSSSGALFTKILTINYARKRKLRILFLFTKILTRILACKIYRNSTTALTLS